MEKFSFEVFCIEPHDIKDEEAFQQALSFSSQLWQEKRPILEITDGVRVVIEQESRIKLKIYPVDTSKIWTGEIDVAFVLKAESEKFEALDGFRERLLKHLRDTLRFKHKRILRDDISTHIANALYPQINKVEILLRRYLIKFFIQKVGLNWWELTAAPTMDKKVSIRRKDRKDILAPYLDTDLEYIDFNELGELIYKQSSGFNQPEKVIEKINAIKEFEEFEKFKSELVGNYSKYFKTYFKDKSFDQAWKELTRIRNKVAHQGSFHENELVNGLKLADSIMNIIETAEAEIDKLVLTTDEKEAIRNAAIENLEQITSDEGPQEPAKTDHRVKIEGPTVVGKIDLSPHYLTANGHKVITEDEMLSELRNAESLQYNDYVGLKWFVTSYLKEKDYSIGFSYSLLNIMAEKGLIEIYEKQAYEGYPIRAIRLPKDLADVENAYS